MKRLLAVTLLAFAAAAPLKPPLAGLISMGRGGENPLNDNADMAGIPGSRLDDVIAKRNAFDAVVINVAWARLQPDGPETLNRAPIDRALADIRAYNADPATTMKLRAVLRVHASITAPEWAKAIGGPPVEVSPKKSMREAFATIGRAWSPPYRAAFRALQARLAALYDAEPLIAQVSATSCTTFDDEPFSLARKFDRRAGFSSLRNIKAAGYTDAAMIECLQQIPQDYAGWRTTPIDLPVGPFFRADEADDFRSPPRDPNVTIGLMRDWRAAMGARAVLGDHTLSYPLNPNFAEVNDAIRRDGPPFEFQTESPRRIDWARTVQQSACVGNRALEIWNGTNAGGYVDMPTEQLIAWSRELKGADAVACP